MNILISGDFYISDDLKNKDLIDKSVIDLFHRADYRLINLEAPITDNKPENKIVKTGPNLRMSEDTVMPYLKQLKVNAVTLANNHILDYGAKGLSDTFRTLGQHKIDYVGAGKNLTEATKPLTIEKDGLRIAILNFCENEWSIAEEEKPGANPMDIIDNANQIKSAKTNHDKVICIIHGGHEYYHLPSPRMQKQYRFYVDNGADAIVGHHTHCIGGYEIYNEVPIIYSLGNFLFTIPNHNVEWYSGLVVVLETSKNSPIYFNLKQISVNTECFQVCINFISEKEELINTLNKQIKDNVKLKIEWENFTQEKINQTITNLSPLTIIKNRYLRYIFRKSIFNKLYFNREFNRILNNQIRCEAHWDLTKCVLKKINN